MRFAIVAILVGIALMSGCASAMTQGQLDARSTRRTFDANPDVAFAATMTVLQDQGYVIQNTDRGSGLIVALLSKEGTLQTVFCKKREEYKTRAVVSEIGQRSEVRISVRRLIHSIEDYQRVRGDLDLRVRVWEPPYESAAHEPFVYMEILDAIHVELARRGEISG